jgi:pilus assembly protein CpaE
VTGTVGIIGGKDRVIEDHVRAAGMRPVVLLPDQLTSPTQTAAPPDVVIVDLRSDAQPLQVLPAIKRRYPTMGIAIVVQSLNPTLMLEAMRAGVTEAISEPITQAGIEEAISHVIAHHAAPVEGRVFAVIGAKGGIGATTIAVNLAEAFAKKTGNVLLIDLQMAAGDANVLLGVEPRFSIAEALENTHRLDETFLRELIVRTKSGLDLLAASPRAIVGQVDPPRIRTLIDFAVRYYRVVVLDVPRGDVSLLESLDSAAGIFVVVNHELPTVRSAQRLASKLRQRYGERVSVLINRSDKQAEISIEDIKKAVAAPIRHILPSDYRVALAAANKGEPIARSTQTKLGASFHDLVRALTAKTAEAERAAPEAGGFFGWLTPRRSA